MDFASIHKSYLPFVRHLAASYPERYREDLIQEGLWGLYLGCRSYDEARGVPFDAFVKVCIRNRMLSALRGFSSDHLLVSLEELPSELPESFVPFEERYAETDALRGAFHEFQSKLSTLEKNVLIRYLAGHSVSEISEELRIPVKSADNAMTRIKKKIREFFSCT